MDLPLLLLSLPAALASCASRTSCSTCITHADLANYECSWCEIDQACHALGSPLSPCVFSRECVSLSKLSTCASSSVDACPASDLLPQQLHIALAGNPSTGEADGVAVAWFTPRQTGRSVVQFGRSAGALDQQAEGSARSYLSNFGWHHRVELPSLSPGATYAYRVGDGAAAWSAVSSFTTVDSSKTATFALSVFGDMGYLNSTVRPMEIKNRDSLQTDWSASYTYNTLRQLVDSRTINGVWHVGDIGYADDAFAHEVATFAYESAYNGYMQWLEPIASKVPYMVTPGNHESECHSPACVTSPGTWGLPLSNFSAFNARWAMPFKSSGGTSNMWYSFNLGPAHFVSVNSETDWKDAPEEGTGDSHFKFLPAGSFGAPGEYLAWLEADLKAAAADRAAGRRQWIVAGGHRPFDDLASSHSALFAKYKVDAYFAGHSHSYTRSTYSFSSTSMLHIVVGGAGCDEMPQAPAVPASQRGSQSNATFHTGRYASGVLRVNASALHWQLLDSADSSILDEFVLSKE
ncbi:hypothetical protein AB1Y20_012043 [Prymnesium parvum]|uniref:Purple acid phosphatase n=1 Tax=Prymnesium parvum TaxID=97485 RepID=A0AB34INL6_PRYPA